MTKQVREDIKDIIASIVFCLMTAMLIVGCMAL